MELECIQMFLIKILRLQNKQLNITKRFKKQPLELFIKMVKTQNIKFKQKHIFKEEIIKEEILSKIYHHLIIEILYLIPIIMDLIIKLIQQIHKNIQLIPKTIHIIQKMNSNQKIIYLILKIILTSQIEQIIFHPKIKDQIETKWILKRVALMIQQKIRIVINSQVLLDKMLITKIMLLPMSSLIEMEEI